MGENNNWIPCHEDLRTVWEALRGRAYLCPMCDGPREFISGEDGAGGFAAVLGDCADCLQNARRESRSGNGIDGEDSSDYGDEEYDIPDDHPVYSTDMYKYEEPDSPLDTSKVDTPDKQTSMEMENSTGKSGGENLKAPPLPTLQESQPSLDSVGNKLSSEVGRRIVAEITDGTFSGVGMRFRYTNEAGPTAVQSSNAEGSAHLLEETVPDPPVSTTLYCVQCGEAPCVFLQLETELLEYDTSFNSNVGGEGADVRNESNSSRRYRCYGHASYLLRGYLGRFNRRRLPNCVEEGIRSLFPDPDGNYVGYHDVGGNSTE